MQSIIDPCAKVACMTEMLNEMAVFSQVIDCGSFSAAARHLGITTSAVSRHVGRLEAHLGGRLLLRTTRALSVTELGQQVHDACARMLASAREVYALAGSDRAGPNGTLRVSAPLVFGQHWLAPKLPGFLAAYPDVDLQLNLINRPVDLVNDGVDVAIRIAEALAPGLASRPLCTFEYVLVASPGYLAERGAPATPEALVEHACCHLGYGRFGGAWTLHQGARSVTVNVKGRVLINHSAAIVALVAAGGAIGLVPDFAANDALRDGSVVRVLADWTVGAPYTGAVHVVYTPGRHVALKIRAFIDYIVAAAEAERRAAARHPGAGAQA
jgi:DNA-binding transcriptional LysR family regulator